MIGSALPQEMPLFQTYFLQYNASLKEPLLKVLGNIQKTYATFRFLPLAHDLSKQITLHYQAIKLTKRKVTFAVIFPLDLTDNPEALPEGSKVITLSDRPEECQGLCLSPSEGWEEVELQLVKLLQLDSVWVGLLYRIGTDIEEFSQYLAKHQHFQEFEVSLLRNFYEILESRLGGGAVLNRGLLEECKNKVEKDLMEYQLRVQELVRSRFNCRTVIKDVTMHPYLNLLDSRSYFNLIYIQAQIMARFQNFRQWVSCKYPHIHEALTFEGFLQIDDYIYSQFVFGCLKKVKKYINRTLQRQPYSMIVERHHRDIIRQFRPSVHEAFLNICLILKERAACLKESVGAIIVKNRNIISTGYNGTPMGTINCYNGGCQVCNNSQKMGTEVLSCRCIHAEYNCILTAGITVTPGAILYSSKVPCLWCAKLIIQGGIAQVICVKSSYHSLEHENIELVKKTLANAQVPLREVLLTFHE